jgi:hypothetical protein
MMRRRDFITLLGGAAVARPPAIAASGVPLTFSRFRQRDSSVPCGTVRLTP